MKIKSTVRAMFLAATMFMFLTACAEGERTRELAIDEVTYIRGTGEEEAPKTPEAPEGMDDTYSEYEAENDLNITDSEETEIYSVVDVEVDAEPPPGQGYFEVLEIKGTAASMTGERWDRMVAWRDAAVLQAKEHRDVVILNMNPNENVVFLTFDDGPDPVNTVSVINTLIEYGVSATFFFTGENIRRHGDIVRMTHEAGFPIGLHGYTHISFLNLTAEEIIDELNESNNLLEAITGVRSTIMRPPFGAMGDEEIALISGQDLTIYLWSLDTLDWAQDDANEILRNIKEYLRPGDIILMHAFSGQHLVPVILPSIIEFIRDSGFEMKALP